MHGRRSLWARVGRLAVGAALALVAGSLEAQLSTLRGKVVDEQGQPIAGVKITMEFKGETRGTAIKHLETDKKGSYIRSGLQGGPWEMTYEKEGYETFKRTTDISLGGISELDPMRLKVAAVKTSVAGLQPDVAAQVAAAAVVGQVLQATYKKGLTAYEQGRVEEAEALLKELVEKAPLVPGPHFWLGQIYLGRNELEPATASFREAAKLAPEDVRVNLAYSTALAVQGKHEDALRALESVADRFPDDADFQFSLGVTLSNMGRDAESLVAFERTATLKPDHVEVSYYLGTLAVSKDPKRAVAYLEKYIAAADPASPNVPIAEQLLAALKGPAAKKK